LRGGLQRRIYISAAGTAGPERGRTLGGVIVDVDGMLYDLGRLRMAWRMVQFGLGRPWEGWRTIRALRAFPALYPSLGELPKPKCTHEFF